MTGSVLSSSRASTPTVAESCSEMEAEDKSCANLNHRKSYALKSALRGTTKERKVGMPPVDAGRQSRIPAFAWCGKLAIYARGYVFVRPRFARFPAVAVHGVEHVSADNKAVREQIPPCGLHRGCADAPFYTCMVTRHSVDDHKTPTTKEWFYSQLLQGHLYWEPDLISPHYAAVKSC